MVENVLGKTLRFGQDTMTLNELVTAHGAPDLVGIYFGAHWAPPCRLFTPALTEFYNKINEKGKRMELVFCSNDGNEAAFERNYATMPFAAIPYPDE